MNMPSYEHYTVLTLTVVAPFPHHIRCSCCCQFCSHYRGQKTPSPNSSQWHNATKSASAVHVLLILVGIIQSGVLYLDIFHNGTFSSERSYFVVSKTQEGKCDGQYVCTVCV